MDGAPLLEVCSRDCEDLRFLIANQVGRRMPDLAVEAQTDHLLVRGSTDSYDTLQLVLAALQSALDRLSERGCRGVRVAVQVGDDQPDVRIACKRDRLVIEHQPGKDNSC